MSKKVNAELKVLLEQLLSKLSKIEERISKLEKHSHKQITLEDIKVRAKELGISVVVPIDMTQRVIPNQLLPGGIFSTYKPATSLCSKTSNRPILIC